MFDRFRDILWRCWTGEFSLGRIFWTGAIAIILVLGFFCYVAPRIIFLLPKAYSPLGVLIAGLLFSPFPFLMPVWIVLLWRAGWGTGNPRKVWSTLAIAFSCGLSLLVVALVHILTPIAADALSGIIDDPQKGLRGVRVSGIDKSVLVYGYISHSVARDLAVALDSDPSVRLVELNSLGGRSAAAEEMADLIRSRGLDTRVSVKCASACTVLFLAGRRRFMRAGALFGFHAASAFNGMIGRGDTESMRQRAIAAGVASWFVARAYQGRKVWVPSTMELQEAGVVTAILPSL
jgi:hypothetical protein